MEGQRSKPQARPGGRKLGEHWAGNAQEVFLGLRDWRALHPKATLAEIETELDRRFARMRAQILSDLALASAAADFQAGERPACPDCGGMLRDEGERARSLGTMGDAVVHLQRDYATCTACGRRLFPPGR